MTRTNAIGSSTAKDSVVGFTGNSPHELNVVSHRRFERAFRPRGRNVTPLPFVRGIVPGGDSVNVTTHASVRRSKTLRQSSAGIG